MYQLRHKNGFDHITCPSYEAARRELFRQWREADGSIPWVIIYNGEEV